MKFSEYPTAQTGRKATSHENYKARGYNQAPNYDELQFNNIYIIAQLIKKIK